MSEEVQRPEKAQGRLLAPAPTRPLGEQLCVGIVPAQMGQVDQVCPQQHHQGRPGKGPASRRRAVTQLPSTLPLEVFPGLCAQAPGAKGTP